MCRRVVYNNCYGGFNISYECYLEMKKAGLKQEIVDEVEKEIDKFLEMHRFVQDSESNPGRIRITICLWNKKKNQIEGWIESGRELSQDLKTPEEYFDECTWDNKEDLEPFIINRENLEKYPERFARLYLFYWKPKRHSRLLLKAIDAIGEERCSGPCSKLRVTEVATELYTVDEYDGRETIEEVYYPDTFNVNDIDDEQ